MQSHRVARSDFCPAARGGSIQIQPKCCRPAPWRDGSQVGTSRMAYLRLHAHFWRLFAIDRWLRSALESFLWRGNGAMAMDADVIVVGAGLSGLVAATEIADAGKRVIVLDQEGEQSLVVRRPVSGRQPRTAPARHQGQLRSGAAGLDG